MTDLTDFSKRNLPGRTPLIGNTVRIEPLDWERHGAQLADAICGLDNTELWRYMPFEPVPDLQTLQTSMTYASKKFTWIPMAIVRVRDEMCVGMASYMRLRPEHGSCEVGCIAFGDALKRTREATEAMYLMARHAFELGYRRYEWKCDNGNEPSKRAALRFGFVYEGLFRQDLIVKGLNRDTAWFSITDKEWPGVRAGFETWLADDNFDGEGRQKRSLAACRV